MRHVTGGGEDSGREIDQCVIVLGYALRSRSIMYICFFHRMSNIPTSYKWRHFHKETDHWEMGSVIRAVSLPVEDLLPHSHRKRTRDRSIGVYFSHRRHGSNFPRKLVLSQRIPYACVTTNLQLSNFVDNSPRLLTLGPIPLHHPGRLMSQGVDRRCKWQDFF